jgi:transcriptional activator protein UGA3
MAMESDPLMKAITAWSSTHVALWRSDVESEALEDRSKALTAFASSITKGDLSAEISLAACLVLTSMDSILGDVEGWFLHLRGAASIIKPTLSEVEGRKRSHLSRTLEGRWLLRNFAYHDILASVSMDCAPMIPDLYWLDEDGNTLDTYFGLASVPVSLLGEISSLRATLKNGSNASAAAEAPIIESKLLEWRPGEAQDCSLVYLADSYRSSALIHLYRTLLHHRQGVVATLNHKIAQEVEAVVRLVGQMPTSSLPVCTLLFPLFMAGGEMVRSDHIQFTRQRMQEMASYRRFENVAKALEVLEEVWDVRARTLPVDPTRPYDWLDVVHRRGWRLS